MESEIRSVTILSDSKSVLQSIANSDVKYLNNSLICDIKYLIYDLKSIYCQVLFVWVKGYSNIVGNEKADNAINLQRNH